MSDLAATVDRQAYAALGEAALIIALLAVAVVVLGEAAVRLRRAGNPLHRPISIVRATLLPSIAVLVFLRSVVGLAADDVWVQVAETAMWIFLVHALLSFTTEVVFGQASEGSWQARTPRLLIDFGRGLLIAAAAAIVASFVWGLDVEKGFAALGLGSIVIGLALQDPLGNLFSGLLVALERPFTVGDWLKIGDRTGRIVEINWRATHILLDDSETLILPNPTLAKETFVNLSRPTPDLHQSVSLTYPASVPPERVKRIILAVLAEIPSILQRPEATVQIASFSDSSITYNVGFSVADVANASAARDAVLTRIWYAGRREGLYRADGAASADEPRDARADAVRLLRSLPAIAAGRAEARDVSQAGVALEEYAPGEIIVRSGEPLRGFYLVVRGSVELAVRTRPGPAHSLGTLAVGEFFGALHQSGEASDVDATARGDTALMLFRDAALEALLASSPQLYRNVREQVRARRVQARALAEGAA